MNTYRVVIAVTDMHGNVTYPPVRVTCTLQEAEEGGRMYADWINTHKPNNTAVFVKAYEVY